jgi:hypothetical protein
MGIIQLEMLLRIDPSVLSLGPVKIHSKKILPVNHLLQIPTVICFPVLIELLQATTHIFFGEYMCFSHCLSNPLYQTSYIT